MNTKETFIEFLKHPRVLSYQQIFDGTILQLYQAVFKSDEGKVIRRDIVHHLPAVGILPITPDDRVVMVKQYRYPIGRETYEIPAGLLELEGDALETPLAAAKRELEEETGYLAQDWTPLGDFYLSAGMSDEKIYLFKARGLTLSSDPLPQDDDEEVQREFMTREQVRKMITLNQIKDIKTFVALQFWLTEGGSDEG